MTRTPAPKLAAKHTPGPWQLGERYGMLKTEIIAPQAGRAVATVWTHEQPTVREPRETKPSEAGQANAHLIAAAPDHALICWAMCVQDGTWEEWPFDGRGEFIFAGLRYATALDEFGCPKLTPALREAISASRAKSIELAEAQQ
jgi:hypothetical protein